MAKREPVVVVWNEAELYAFLHNPAGPIGADLLTRLGAIVTAGAKRRAEKRTGTMAREIRFEIGSDEAGLYADILSPAQAPKTGFPYPVVHEGKKVRDRRAHRSLRPALNDVRKVNFETFG